MTMLPPGVKVHLALGYTDMRKGIDGLAMLVQGVLRQDPFSGHLFVFRGRTRANLIKVIYWDGTGLCLFTKRLEHGVFLWPPSIEPGETLSMSSVQLSLLLEGVDWRAPEQRWRPAVAGYSDASNLKKDDADVWRGKASKCTQSTNVSVDFQAMSSANRERPCSHRSNQQDIRLALTISGLYNTYPDAQAGSNALKPPVSAPATSAFSQAMPTNGTARTDRLQRRTG